MCRPRSELWKTVEGTGTPNDQGVPVPYQCSGHTCYGLSVCLLHLLVTEPGGTADMLLSLPGVCHWKAGSVLLPTNPFFVFFFFFPLLLTTLDSATFPRSLLKRHLFCDAFHFSLCILESSALFFSSEAPSWVVTGSCFPSPLSLLSSRDVSHRLSFPLFFSLT